MPKTAHDTSDLSIRNDAKWVFVSNGPHNQQ